MHSLNNHVRVFNLYDTREKNSTWSIIQLRLGNTTGPGIIIGDEEPVA
jgi:hypothetical protein